MEIIEGYVKTDIRTAKDFAERFRPLLERITELEGKSQKMSQEDQDITERIQRYVK